jgi:isocitrate/isopropylmalate dehydrogenase
MLLEHLELLDAAKAIEQALRAVLAQGRVRTRDMGGKASTAEMGDAVADKIHDS